VSEKLQILTEISGNTVKVTFQGTIDEDADFEKLKSLSLEEYIFDFEKVDLINSCGIREWISFLESLDSSVKTKYRKCPQIIVEQMNMVKGFIKDGGEIESFYAPYFCEEEDREIKVLLTATQVSGGKAPNVKDENGHTLEFDDIEEQYFQFLKNS
jgi:anti-anti-sigma regulatory factor